MRNYSIVIDTNVLLAALRSNQGASFRLLKLLGTDTFTSVISVALILEYEEIALRYMDETGLTERDLADVLDYVCSVSHEHRIHFLWRPFLKDPEDDMVLELAVAASCQYIVTFNTKDFIGVEEQFGIQVINPKAFLQLIGALP